MQGGIIGSVCFLFLAFLLSIGRTEDSTAQEDSNIGDSRLAFENQNEESRSGALVESSAFSDGSTSQSESIAESSAGSASASFGYGSFSSVDFKALGDSETQGTSLTLKNNPYLLQGSNSAQGISEAQNTNAYKSPGYSLSLPKYSEIKSVPNFLFNSGGYSPAKEETETSSGSLLYNAQSPYSSLSSFPYNSNLNSAQATLEPDAHILSLSSLLSSYDVKNSPVQTQAEFNTKTLSESPYSYGQGLNYYYSYNQDAQIDNAAVLSGVGNSIPVSPSALQPSVISMSINGDKGNLLNVELSKFSPYSLDASNAKTHADAHATAANKYLNIYSPHILSNINSAQTSIDATTQSNIHENLPYGQMSVSYYPSSTARYNPASISNGISNPYNPDFNPFYLPPRYPSYNSGSSSATFSTEVIANSAAKDPHSTPMDLSLPLETSAQALAEAQGTLISGENFYGQGIVPLEYYIPGSTAQSPAKFSAQATSLSLSSNASSRLLQPHEYIYPNKFPGNENQLQCSRVHEMWYMWASVYECLVCVCVGDPNSGLQPICALCAGCQAPPRALNPPSPPNPQTVRPPQPELFPIATTPTPVPEVSVTCSPLPTGRPFTNPLNPCQLCVCTESTDSLGMPDVQIECQENPQCVLPPDVTILPPVPGLVPIPLPTCEEFPPNVMFPHPGDRCKLCMCSVELSEHGLPEQQVTCYPNPECLVPSPDPAPVTEPVSSPQPIPDIIIVEPMMPWSPITTPAPPSPEPSGPLPGPSPHESCRPFAANQPFQHPWDECQMCVCTEAYSVGMVTVEVNCFTRKSCCIETPDNIKSVTLPSPPPSPAPYQAPGKIIIKDSICELRSFLTEFLHPDDNCQICVCALSGGVVSASCKQSSAPRCLAYQSGSVNSEAQVSNEVYNGLQPTLSAGYRPTPVSSYPTGGSKIQPIANAIVPSSQGFYLPSYQSGRPIVHSSSQTEAQSQAQSNNGQSIASAESEVNSEYNQNQFANYNMIPGNYDNQGFNFGSLPDQFLSTGSQVPGSQFKNPGYGIYNNRENLINGFSGLTSYKNPMLYQGIPASAMHTPLYSRPSYPVSPPHQTGQFRDMNSQTEAQSTASNSNAQGQASASSGTGKFQTKSGRPDDAE